MMPNGDPRDGFFYPTLTLMIDSYNKFAINVNVIESPEIAMFSVLVLFKWSQCHNEKHERS